DPTSGWIIDVYFESLVDYTTWIASGGITTNDPQRTERLYGAVDFSKPYLLQGFGDYTGADLSLVENSDHQYMDLGPHADSYGDYGMGLWLAYQGTVNGQTVSEGTIEGAASLTKCVRIRGRLILREWKVTDAAGNTNVFIQRVELEE
ncbi:MAG: hypothetical protein KDC56_11175, partial [Flavobacteriaceae bacterium]|nr:hypothetical protein [Flavobacteriaceae bacterium]